MRKCKRLEGKKINYFEKKKICKLRKLKNMKLENDKKIHYSRVEQNERLKQTERPGLVNKYLQEDNLGKLPVKHKVIVGLEE
jgi:hypothetical protein